MKKIIKFFVCVISVVVTVMALGISACSKDVLATQVSLDETELIMVKGNSAQLNASVDENATDNSIEWKSSDESKFTVSETGLVTAVDEGEATITVSTKDGSNLTDTCKVYSAKAGEIACIKLKGNAAVPTVKGNSTINVEDYIECLPANATNKKISFELDSNTPPDVATMISNPFNPSEKYLTAGVTDGEITVKITANSGKTSFDLKLKVELQAKDYPENYFESITHKGTLEKKYAVYGSSVVKEIIKKNVTGKAEITAYKIWYPAELETSSDKYPAVACLNGSGTTYADCEPLYKHLASWGFIVIGNNQPQAVSGISGLESVEILKELNADSASPLYNKINLEKIGLQGGSQGGTGAFNTVTSDSPLNTFASLITLSAAKKGVLDWTYDLSSIKIPCFMLQGDGPFDSELVTSLRALKENFEECNGETYMARRKGADHEDIPKVADSYLTAWFLYTLKGDKEAEKVFKGDNPELFNNANWIDVDSKNN